MRNAAAFVIISHHERQRRTFVPRSPPHLLRIAQLMILLIHTASQHALGARNITPACTSFVPPLTSNPTRHCERLERTFRPVMVVVAIDTLDMQRDACGLRKTLKPMRDHLRRQIADLLAREAQINYRVGSVAEIDDGPGQSLVERGVATAEADQAGAGAEGFVEGGSQGEKDVFGGVVVVDEEIAGGADGERPAGVLGEGVEHVIEEADACGDGDLLGGGYLSGMVRGGEGNEHVRVLLLLGGGDVGGEVFGVLEGLESAAIQREGDLDLGFVGDAVDRGGTAGG